MERVFVIYNLKPGVSIDEYRKFSIDIDQKITPNQAGIDKQEIYSIKRADTEYPKFQIVEIFDVDSWEAYKKIMGSEVMKPVFKEWEKYCDTSSVVTLYGEKIE